MGIMILLVINIENPEEENMICLFLYGSPSYTTFLYDGLVIFYMTGD